MFEGESPLCEKASSALSEAKENAFIVLWSIERHIISILFFLSLERQPIKQERPHPVVLLESIYIINMTTGLY